MIVLGRIVAPFGVGGWLKIHPFGDDPVSWRKMQQWWIGTNADSQDPSDWQPRKLVGCRAHGKGIVAALDGVADRSAAEALDGYYIAAPREAMPAPADDEYYWGDLVGLKVINLRGEPLGMIRSLIETGAHDVLEVVDEKGARLIPFVAAIVQNVNIAKGEVCVEWEADW